MRYVEISERGQSALAQRGITADADREALERNRCRDPRAARQSHWGGGGTKLSRMLKPGTMLIALDIAAPMAGALPKRDDLTYFVTHPCHPSVFGGETDPAHRTIFSAALCARRISSARWCKVPRKLMQSGEAIARAIYAPVLNSHRCTAEQMAILEPVLSETVLGTCLTIVGEAMQEAVKLGVPEAAARDFLLGHLKVELGIVFKLFEGATFSDGALKAIEEAKRSIFQPGLEEGFRARRVDEKHPEDYRTAGSESRARPAAVA